MKLPAGWSSLKMEREVMVGTIPLRESWPQPPTAPNQPPQQPTLEQPAVEPTAPPSYEEGKQYHNLFWDSHRAV